MQETAAHEAVSPAEADREAAEAHGGFDERPELYVGAALAGGFLLALILRKLGPDD